MFPRSTLVSKTESNRISFIVDGLYLSGLGGVTKENALEMLNITHVLNVAVELSKLKYNCDGLIIRNVHLQDNTRENILPHLRILVEYIHTVITKGDNIVVHCVGGVSRSATICIAYLMMKQGMTLRQAYTHIINQRTVVHPNKAFWKSLVIFEEELYGRTSVEMLPYVIGLVPDVYRQETERQILNGWMDYLFWTWFCHLIIVALQILFV